MTYEPHTYCHRCGTAYVRVDPEMEWPRRCPNCANLQFFNPEPIGVMLQQVTDGSRTGIATPIRGHQPMRGHPAITGGFHEGWDHSSQDAGRREIAEEIKLPRTPGDDEAEIIHTQCTGPFIPGRRQLLVFSMSQDIVPISIFDGFQPDAETMAMHYSWNPEVLGFPSHTAALARYFQRYHGITPPKHFVHQPRTGDPIGSHGAKVFEVPYAQPFLNDGIWCVLAEDAGEPFPVRNKDGVWHLA